MSEKKTNRERLHEFVERFFASADEINSFTKEERHEMIEAEDDFIEAAASHLAIIEKVIFRPPRKVTWSIICFWPRWHWPASIAPAPMLLAD